MNFDELKNLLIADRTVRRFDASMKVSREVLENLVSLTPYCASGRNAQPLRYRIVDQTDECDALYPALAWAGYYKDWDGPEEFERPVAYLVQCLDRKYGKDCLCDDGLQLQAITLGATTLGLACCIIKAFDPEMVKEALHLPEGMAPRYVVAIGYPVEQIKIEWMESEDADFKYYRTPDGIHHVPKRPIAQLLIK